MPLTAVVLVLVAAVVHGSWNLLLKREGGRSDVVLGALVVGVVLTAPLLAFYPLRSVPLEGWLLILVCGTLGNVVTAWMHRTENFTSLGASTAVFAALGILSGHGLAETFRDRTNLPWARITAPVLAGVVLLGWLGSGNGTNTDVMGHVFGFGSGLVAGATFESARDSRTEEI